MAGAPATAAFDAAAVRQSSADRHRQLHGDSLQMVRATCSATSSRSRTADRACGAPLQKRLSFPSASAVIAGSDLCRADAGPCAGGNRPQPAVMQLCVFFIGDWRVLMTMLSRGSGGGKDLLSGRSVPSPNARCAGATSPCRGVAQQYRSTDGCHRHARHGDA
jgi:hypothetical protein